jgi:Reverse transcriptase (RNA-dependent DNA polymerase)
MNTLAEIKNTSKSHCSFYITSPLKSGTPTLIADSGCTAHFCTTTLPVTDKTIAARPLTIRNPNGSTMKSTHTALLDIPALPLAARTVHIVPDLHENSLISIGQLCDADCTVAFTKHDVTVAYQNEPVLTGSRTPPHGLWHLDPSDSMHHANAAVGAASPADLVAFAHAAMFSPALSTLAMALTKGYLSNFPGLSSALLRKFPPQSAPMIKGHLDQVRQNNQSTKLMPQSEPDDEFPPSLDSTDSSATHQCYAAIFEPTGQIYTDQTGRFVAPSSTGNNYLIVLYDYDSNSIQAEPMKNRSAESILAAYKVLHSRLCAAGLRPQLQRLDNECSTILKQFMQAEGVDYQLVPPGVHRRNAAERAIRTFKNHFIAGLCSLDKDFPLHLWDRLLPQALLTLNLLRGSRTNPKLSAYAQLHGNFDFNRTPIAPPGIRVLVHEKPSNRGTWAPHALDGWYVGPALESYRCHRVWMWDTRAVRICDTLTWMPTRLSMPTPSSHTVISEHLREIIRLLKQPASHLNLHPLPESHLHAIETLASIFPAKPTEPVYTPEKDDTSTMPPSAPTPAPIPPAIEPPMPRDLEPPIVAAPAPRVPLMAAPAPRVPVLATPTPPLAPTLAPKLPTPPAPGPVPPPRVVAAPTRTAQLPPATYESAMARRSRRERRQPAKLLDSIPTHAALLGSAVNPDTGVIAEYAELAASSQGAAWQQANADEIGRLCTGHGPDMPTGTDTMRFIHKSDIPNGKKPTYLRIVCAYRPEKTNPHRVRYTVGGDRLEYSGDVSTKAADISTVKCLLNSVVSTPNAKFITADIKDFYLNTPMDPADYEYMRIPASAIPGCIQEEYKLHDKISNGMAYVQVRKGMYGLKQAGRLANDQLTKFLAEAGYHPCPITPGLWTHETRPIWFSLVVDDFGIKYTDIADAEHLLATLRAHYTISLDMSGTRYCGLTIAWDYNCRTCDISMPGYIARALERFQHPHPARPQHSPHPWLKPVYGKSPQLTPEIIHSPPLGPADKKRVQEILGTLLYYARAVDSTLLAAISSLASQQTKGTQATMRSITQLLNYCATHPDATIRFIASDMILHVASDASYLSEDGAKSRAAGYHFLSAHPDKNHKNPPSNGAITVFCQILREVVSSAAEAELAGLFHNCREACALRITLAELGHEQPATPIQTDNSTAAGIANDSVKQRRSKAIDMRFYWVRDRVRQGQFKIHWQKGSLNQADYFTKHHPPSHHQAIRSAYLHEPAACNKNFFDILRDDDDDDDDDGDATQDAFRDQEHAQPAISFAPIEPA